MNERIKELAEQAALLGPSSRVGNAHEATEKFAELIVGKFVEICNQAILHNEDMLPKFNKPSELYEKLVTHGAILQAEKLSNEIKEYFGVEE